MRLRKFAQSPWNARPRGMRKQTFKPLRSALSKKSSASWSFGRSPYSTFAALYACATVNPDAASSLVFAPPFCLAHREVDFPPDLWRAVLGDAVGRRHRPQNDRGRDRDVALLREQDPPAAAAAAAAGTCHRQLDRALAAPGDLQRHVDV